MANVDDSIILKIGHLLRLSEDKGATPNEAAVALEKAQALLLRHNLDRASIQLDDGTKPVSQAIGKVEVEEQHGYAWKRSLLHQIARNSLCRVIGDPSAKAAHLFGSQTNVRAVLEMYGWVSEQLEKMALKDLKTYQKGGGVSHGRTWKASYYMGATRTIGDRLREPMAAFQAGEGQALVVVNKEALAFAVRQAFPHTKRGSAGSIGSEAGYRSGEQAGAGVSFARQQQLGGGHLALPSGK